MTAARYYQLLADFLELNERLISQGQPYAAVILCHELYRFLYPVEPYADFVNNDPVEFSHRHLAKLLELGNKLARIVVPYNVNLREFDPTHQDALLEKSTSDLYSVLWKDFDLRTLTEESVQLLQQRLSQEIIAENIVGKTVLDMGCGSGRYTIALARIGARQVVGIDVQAKAFAAARNWCREYRLPVDFQEGNVLELPLADNYFDFVFCNGVLHHAISIRQGLQELSRVLQPAGKAFLYLYAAGGIFWNTRKALREVFTRIPLSYTQMVLRAIGMPGNRFIFCDTWYVPVETYTTTEELITLLEETGFDYEKVCGNSPFDLDKAIAAGITGAAEMWGDGEHRYLLGKRTVK